MLTLEFKAELTPEQQLLVDVWLEQLRPVWNRALSELNQFDEFTGYYIKEEKSYAPCCPTKLQRRYIYIDDKGCWTTKEDKKAKEKIIVPYCPILDERSRWYQKQMTRVRIPEKAEKKNSWGWKSPQDSPGCTGYSCPIPQYYRKPFLQNPKAQTSGGLELIIKKENIHDLLEIIVKYQSKERGCDIPQVKYKYMQGLMGQLSVSWQEYLKSRYGTAEVARGKPKFKRQQDKLNTLIFVNSQNKGKRPIVVHPEHKDALRGVPGLGTIKVKTLNKRWCNPDGSIPDICTFRITKRASGYFVQLSGDIYKNFKLRKNTNKAVGIDPGINHLLAFDNGKAYENPRFIRQAEKRRIKLEQQLAQKRVHRLVLWLNHPERTPNDLRKICPAISIESATNLLASHANNEKHILEHISAASLNTLKYNAIPKSKAIVQLDRRIARMHEQVKMQRLSNDHKITTYIVRTYQAIAFEDTQPKNMSRKAKPKEKQDGSGYERNAAKAKSGLNKSILDASIGRKKAFLEQKAASAGRQFFTPSAHYSSQECPVCGHRQDMPLSERWFVCGDCGWECDRDQKAGISLILSVYDQGAITKDQLSSQVQQVLALRNARMGSCKNQKTQKKTRKPRSKSDSAD
jgi:putative transposase